MPLVTLGYGHEAQAGGGSVYIGNPQLDMKMGGNLVLERQSDIQLFFESPVELILEQGGEVTLTARPELKLEIE